MTRVDGINAVSNTNAAEQAKKQQKKDEKVVITFSNPDRINYADKSARKQRQADLTEKYLSLEAEYYDAKSDEKLTDKLTNKEAKNFAKRQVQNEQRLQNFLDTQAFMSKEEYDAAVKAKKAGTAYQNVNLQYIQDKDVRNWVEKNEHKFYQDGKFSSDLYKQEMAKWVGTDYKMNLDEKSALSAGGDRMSKGDAKKAAKYAGIDVEKDLTWLYKAGAFLGVAAAGTGLGAITGGMVTGKANFNSYVVGNHQNGTSEILGEQHTSSNAKAKGRQIGAWAGLIGSLPGAILAAAQAKDNGEKDVFQNAEAEKVVKDPDGILNVTEKDGCRTIARAILALPNLSENEKIATLEYAYGKNTGKTVNRNELIAAYEAAKQINDLPPEKVEVPEVSDLTIKTEAPTPDGKIVPLPEKKQEEKPEEKQEQEVHESKQYTVTVQNGESIARLAKKYGVSAKEIMELNKSQLRNFKSATDCGGKKIVGFRVGAQIKLPENANEEAVKKNQETNSQKEQAKYSKSMKTLDGKLCPDRTQSYKTMDENFRKKNKIRTSSEAEYQKEKEQEAFAKKYPCIARPVKKSANETTKKAPAPAKKEAPKTLPGLGNPFAKKEAPKTLPGWGDPFAKKETPKVLPGWEFPFANN